MSHIPKKSLINPAFEGYKLSVISQDDAVLRYALPSRTTQATTSGKIPLSFQEMQSRITHNHLSVNDETNLLFYVDVDYRVVLIQLEAEEPSFRCVLEMPAPIQSDSATLFHREYPSAMSVGPTLGLASDGCGLLYVFPVQDHGAAEAIGTFYLPGDAHHTPFKMHYCYRPSPTSVVVVLSSKSQNEEDDNGGSIQPKSGFDIWAVQINLLSLRPGNSPRPFEILWRRHGNDVPIFGSHISQLNSHILIGESTYRTQNSSIQTPYEPSPSEIAPIPRPNENLDSSQAQDQPPKPPPYSWTQTSDSVTVAIPLPSATSKNNIRVMFTTKTVTVHVDFNAPTAIPVPRYSAKQLWDGISPSSSLWTWDKTAEHTYGLLTLHLEKQHEGTRWSQVFASPGNKGSNPTSSSSSADDVEVDVPETLDPSELWKIREALEKYTVSLRDGSDTSGLGLGSGVPSLASGEIDDEVDMSVGRKVYLTWVAADGLDPTWVKPTEQIPFQLLATLLPGLPTTELPLVIKHNLDGLVFTIDLSQPEEPSWVHSSTYSAIAFVLASKRDARFTHIVPSKALLSFESGGRGRGGNLYVYRPAPTKSQWAKQSVLRVDGGEGETLLGVAGVTNAVGEFIVVCLTEGSLVLIRQI
ncbi:hypothetical protein FA15DRAFT_149399 [Coprinopsis marcescibilis]|uniref:NudC domain-containing protein 1 n=1 Tax=Coprinopsis marcescibilis TaxID=230819 RepID=A0A5C3L4L7_COPMA|nr:hypothetical protein FA15DRAFT_149399 [Coprinopsis marcescibilis]